MKISGHIDLCGAELIEGWLYCDAWYGDAIKLQVYVGDDLIGECVVEKYRADLQAAGYGDGRCGFTFWVPEGYTSDSFQNTRLRIVDSPVYMLPDAFTAFPAVEAPASPAVKAK